ncbi:putative neurofilament medium polypeptide [Cocos nucifera]|uniref:Putative neurofilament medium polypeptide n=1 Tax=Cocos nucifera TaxID=13894 RepID=A0A8K0HRY5_COCNU|nr:putative neurofilament medium polypeptide [Cocos nucifera]
MGREVLLVVVEVAEAEVVEEGCTTPTAAECRIPEAVACPPAPRKPRNSPIVEEKKEVHNIKDTVGENVSQPKKVEGKDEEANLQVDNSTNTETTLTGSEGKQQGKSDSAVEVKKKEEDNDKASGSDDLVGHGVEVVDNAKKEAETSATSEPAVEGTGEDLKNQPDVSNTPVPQSEVVEKPKEGFEASSVQESESEASKKQAVSESVTENVKGGVTEPSTVPSSISQEENKQEEPPMVSTAKAPASYGIETLGTEEGAKASQDEKKNFEETVALEKLSAVVTDVAKLQEAGKGAVALEVPASDGIETLGTEEGAKTSQDEKKNFKETVALENLSAVVTDVAKLLEAGKGAGALEAPASDGIETLGTEEGAKTSQDEKNDFEETVALENLSAVVTDVAKLQEAPASGGIETLGTEEGAKTSQDEKKNFEETVALENLSAVVTDAAKLQEAGKGAVALEATDAPQKTDIDLNASRDVEESAKEEMGSGKVEEVVKEVAVGAGKPDPSAAIELVEAADESSGIKITEDSKKPEAQVEEQKQEKITGAEEQNLREKSKIHTASEVAEVAYEGEKVTGSTEKVEEKKNERLESNEPTLVETSKDLKAATEVSEVSSEERKVSEGADIVKDKDEHLKSKEKITRDLDAASIVAEASSQEEKTSKGAVIFEEKKDEDLKDEKVSGLETSKDFDAASEVAEFSSQEKASGILEIVAEKKEESLESDKTTSIETSESSDAAAVSSKDEKSSIAVEMVDKKDNSLEGDKPILVATSKDLDVVTDVSGVSLVEGRTSGGTEMVQEKDEKEKSPEGTETINEKKNEALEGARKTLGETFKEHDMEAKNVIAAPAAEPVADSEEIEKDKELAKDIAETGKPDEGNLVEPSKDGDVTKQDKEVPKQAVHKTSKHQSSNILSKMKHLIVKAKKAILGKSPSSKTISAGTKDDIQVK